MLSSFFMQEIIAPMKLALQVLFFLAIAGTSCCAEDKFSANNLFASTEEAERNVSLTSVFVQVKEGVGHDELIKSLSAQATRSKTLHFQTFRILTDYIAVKGTQAEIESLADHPHVAGIFDDPDRFLPEYETPRKPQNGEVMHQIPDYGVGLIHAREAHSRGYSGQGMKVCVIDSGFDMSHPDVDITKFEGGGPLPWFWDGYGHGTHVTGIIAALNNDIGTLGVAFDASINVQRVFDDGGWFSTATEILQVEECVLDAGAQIINLSLGGYGYSAPEEYFYRVIREKFGVLVVAAAGNDGNTPWGTQYLYPAAYDTVRWPACVQICQSDSFMRSHIFSLHAIGTWSWRIR